ncbi:MAG: 2,3-bisphosphoglycerate-independent phosphoglycerate mutase [Bacteroidota bacterium]|nr:2,3-bisphosphoglycerate-independent phosphoglycerate mutase [Bacteroidota bacterium]
MKKVALIILDGWGLGDGSKSDAIAMAQTPFVDSLYKKHPHSTLKTSGEYVGLPAGQMGNSEVGHLNIGAGRIVYQDLALINKEVREKTIDQHPALLNAFQYAREKGKSVHFMGLVSDGGVHSSQDHLHHLCDMTVASGLNSVFIHAFLDGRDTDPRSGLTFMKKLEDHILGKPIKIASACGRYYAMDRDKRWERVKIAYDCLVKGSGAKTENILEEIKKSYIENVTDEFILPVVRVDGSGNVIGTIQPGDVVICFNYRTDRCREITQVLTQADMPEQGMNTLPLYYVTMTNYDETFKNVHVVYGKDNLRMTLGEVLEKNGKSQIRIAETEKYPHVTFFFSGGREKEFIGEKRLMIPSPKVATYDLQPEMSAIEMTEAILPEIKNATADFICLNFANADMVGHTGDFNAVIKAVETVDACASRIVEAGIQNGYSFIIIADHGNSDFMINADGSPNTAHSTNPVPCILIDADHKFIRSGKLADIAPTVLTLLNIPIPKEMDGTVLI